MQSMVHFGGQIIPSCINSIILDRTSYCLSWSVLNWPTTTPPNLIGRSSDINLAARAGARIFYWGKDSPSYGEKIIPLQGSKSVARPKIGNRFPVTPVTFSPGFHDQKHIKKHTHHPAVISIIIIALLLFQWRWSYRLLVVACWPNAYCISFGLIFLFWSGFPDTL